MLTEYTVIPIFIIPFLIASVIYAATRGICYFAGNMRTDNEKVVQMATDIRFLHWPSRMHALKYGRGQLREYWVLGLRLLMKITGMKPDDHVNIVLALLSNAISAIVIFFIANHYFGNVAGIFAFGVYITCLWPYHVSIFMGHVLLAQALFLLAVLALVLTDAMPALAIPLYVASGVLAGMSFSSSSSSRKYPFMFFAALIFQNSNFFVMAYDPSFEAGQFVEPWALIIFGAPTTTMLILMTIKQRIAKTIVARVQARMGKRWNHAKLSHFQSLVSGQMSGYLLWGIALCLTLYITQPEGQFYINALACICGLVLIAVHVLSPNFITNVLRYRVWMDQTNWVSHFVVWKSHHEEVFGRKLPHNFRGGGITWSPRFLSQMIPVIVVLYLMSLITLIADTAYKINRNEVEEYQGVASLCAIVFVSLIPLVVSEVSKSLQVGKSYFPTLIGFLVLITAAGTAIIEMAGDRMWAQTSLIIGASALILWQSSISVQALAKDVIPARMGAADLYKFLKAHGVTSFHTYHNPYNDGFVESMLYSHPCEFEVKYIESIADANGGIVVIPPTSAKSVEMSSERYGVENGDFRIDPDLVKLLDSEDLEQLCMAKLGSRGTSRYFVHESEVTSYRSIFLNQYSEHDRWLSHGWVLDTKVLGSST